MQEQNENEDDDPRTPISKNLHSSTDSQAKLKKILGGAKLEELPLDFIGTQFFADLYVLDAILGCGSFGVALKVVEKSTAQELAMKVYFKSIIFE